MTALVQDSTGNDLTYRIIGAAMAVHNALGPGYKGEVYERALEVELQARSVPAQRQVEVPVTHDGVTVAVFFLDLLVENEVVVEAKAFRAPSRTHRSLVKETPRRKPRESAETAEAMDELRTRRRYPLRPLRAPRFC